MSQRNVERLRRSYETFNVTRTVDLSLFAPDIEYVQTADVGVGETVFRGREGVAQAVGELTDAFEDFSVEPERYIPQMKTGAVFGAPSDSADCLNVAIERSTNFSVAARS